MGTFSSDLLEELLFHCYQLGVIEDVRKKAREIMEKNQDTKILEAYETAFEIIRSNGNTQS